MVATLRGLNKTLHHRLHILFHCQIRSTQQKNEPEDLIPLSIKRKNKTRTKVHLDCRQFLFLFWIIVNKHLYWSLNNPIWQLLINKNWRYDRQSPSKNVKRTHTMITTRIISMSSKILDIKTLHRSSYQKLENMPKILWLDPREKTKVLITVSLKQKSQRIVAITD